MDEGREEGRDRVRRGLGRAPDEQGLVLAGAAVAGLAPGGPVGLALGGLACLFRRRRSPLQEEEGVSPWIDRMARPRDGLQSVHTHRPRSGGGGALLREGGPISYEARLSIFF